MRFWTSGWLASACTVSATFGASLDYKNELFGQLVEQVPGILKTLDEQTGRFGTGIWICRDQQVMYPLAAAYVRKAEGNPYHNDKKLLDIIMKAGDALIDDADEQGKWVFRKKDGSTWGMIWMPWTYSRWVRTFDLIKEDMPPARRKRWADALVLGYTGIEKSALGKVHNIPTHHAMGLYFAGRALDRPAWCERAAAFMMDVVGEQAEAGYWSEHAGPVVNYNFVYMDALGTYLAASKDERVLGALERGARFHRILRYPNGHAIETVDERNPYKARVDVGNVGFTFSPEGRSYLSEQWERYGRNRLPSDLIASLVLYGQEGRTATAGKGGSGEERFILKEDGKAKAATVRWGPWFASLSAYTSPVPKSRWIQDRQNLVSIYHDKVGVILGGGNTKLQPGWSNFTVGDMELLKHIPGDINPAFLPKGELYHVPVQATLVFEPPVGLDLAYGSETCKVRLVRRDDGMLDYRLETTSRSGLPVAAHLTLIPHLGEALKTGTGETRTLGETPFELTAEQIGGTIDHGGYRLHVPATASVLWPTLPHNPYRKDGHATAEEGRIEIRIPFDQQHLLQTVTIEIFK